MHVQLIQLADHSLKHLFILEQKTGDVSRGDIWPLFVDSSTSTARVFNYLLLVNKNNEVPHLDEVRWSSICACIQLEATIIHPIDGKLSFQKPKLTFMSSLNALPPKTITSDSLLNRVDEIRNVDYIPNNDDILQSRRRTSEIQKLEFQVKLPVKSGPNIHQTFCMFDVGGQRGERRKWIQVFDGVSAVMFLIDSSSFDAIDDENGRNKLRETINLFHEVWTTRFLLNSNFVLLFNKQDILKEKIQRGHKIEDHFPEYKQYKCQPQDRALTSRAGEKLNLFRISSRSSRSSAARTNPSGTNSSCASSGGSIREKRKSSLYRLSNSSTSSTVSSSPIPNNSQNNNHHQSQNQHQSITSTAATTSSDTQKQQQASPDLAYLKARSFIRDKFLQVTRQTDHDQRKLSTPNIMYNSGGRLVDQPKRNVCYHYTTATDTDNIRDLFENLQKMVIKSTMKDLR